MRFLENNVTFASGRVTLIAIHSKAQKLKRLPIRYLDFSFPFKLPKTKEVIKAFQNYAKIEAFAKGRCHIYIFICNIARCRMICTGGKKELTSQSALSFLT